MLKRLRKATTLVEVLIAVAVGSMVMGMAMVLYWQGTRHGTIAQDHASIARKRCWCSKRSAATWIS